MAIIIQCSYTNNYVKYFLFYVHYIIPIHLRPFPLSGGFYSDTLGYVAESCMKCPNGSYVPYDKKPGKSVLDCKTCPEGKQLAGLRTFSHLKYSAYVHKANACTRAVF